MVEDVMNVMGLHDTVGGGANATTLNTKMGVNDRSSRSTTDFDSTLGKAAASNVRKAHRGTIVMELPSIDRDKDRDRDRDRSIGLDRDGDREREDQENTPSMVPFGDIEKNTITIGGEGGRNKPNKPNKPNKKNETNGPNEPERRTRAQRPQGVTKLQLQFPKPSAYEPSR